jgi:MSHA biogenesis protein MshL
MNTTHDAWCWTIKHGLAISVTALLLSGCVSTGTTPPGAVLDAIQMEMGAALKPTLKAESQTKAVDLALLPDMPSGQAKPADARFDLVVQNAPATQVFMGIVSGTPFSMLLSPEVSGSLTLTLKQVTVKEALDTIRDLNGYDYRVEGNRIFVQGNSLQTRVFQVNYLAGRRSGRTDTRVSSTSISGSAGGSSASVPAPAAGATSTASSSGSSNGASVATTSDSDFWRDVQQALTTVVGTAEGRSVVLNASSGVIVVRAMPNELRNVEAYLKATQLVIERQVMLEAKILEVSLSEESQSGVNWATFGGNANRSAIGSLSPSTTLGATGELTGPNTTITAGRAVGALATGLAKGFYGVAFQSANFAAMLNFLESQGTVSVLSSPRVATLNNQKAVLKVGSDEFFVTNVSTTTTTGTGATTTSPTVTLQPFFSGIALDVTPQIDAADQIILHVHPSISLVSEKTKTIDLGAGGSLILPLAASTINESDSIVRVKDGNIVAIGGLMRQRQVGDRSGLPGTAEIAGGSLFGQKSRSMTKSELVILIKPTVIKDDADWQGSMKEAQTRLQDYAPSAPVRIIRP